MDNNDQLVGTVKTMKEGNLTMETSYSSSNKDFVIKWKKVKKINTSSKYLIYVAPGKRYNGSLKSAEDDRIAIRRKTDTIWVKRFKDIVYLSEVSSNFFGKFTGDISVGYNITKAQRSTELAIRSNLGYHADHWTLSASYDGNQSSRQHSETLKRSRLLLDYQYFLRNDWYTLTQLSWFSNTEQNIRLRNLTKLGMGKLFIETYQMAWGAEVGYTHNREKYYPDAQEPPLSSSELLMATNLSLYQLKRVKLSSSLRTFPSLTESGRWRFDFDINFKYKFTRDFFVQVGYTLNHDNRPINGASSTDYILQTTLGWELN